MTTPSSTLAAQLHASVSDGEAGLTRLGQDLPRLLAQPVDRRDRVRCLLAAYALRTGPLGVSTRWADHPTLAALRWALESQWLAELEAVPLPERLPVPASRAADDATTETVAAMRWLAATDRLPDVYRWVAKDATLPDIVSFLSLEGGPDAGFDDLVAAGQIGLAGRAKMELATNYWDEMGNGDLDAVHTNVHARMADALGIVAIPESRQSLAALERAALCSMLAANHWLQPELLGALGLTELQAGPRCRQVVQGLRRTRAPEASIPFYDVHADVDPRHGRDWVDNALVPLVAERPDWAPRIVRGAWWRSLVNANFFASVAPARSTGRLAAHCEDVAAA